MKEEKCCCGLFTITTAAKIILWLTVLGGIVHAATPSILNLSLSAMLFMKVAMIVAVLCSILAIIGIYKDAPKLMKPIIVFYVIVQVFLLLEIFYSIAAAIFPSIPLPEAIKDFQDEYELHLHSVEDKAKNIFQSIALAMLIINIILYAISLRVLIILIKCFFSIKSKRYQPVPSIYRMPPRPTLPLVVKKNEDNKLTGSQTPETAIEMSNV
ncbi:hypothetical protein PRIPAC_82567 [Pristionchus pacificus]|uniref:Uncharacterized protein n=1 Tax=Pristionchus pacificus TaxID=54126 RepID=A0A2A6C2U5_PRIPA|nr:hypothetical protein PRIPAC_82567 [Pristionchus pacificus]|eukprot:PDM72351.1 hypothetical protein PRIPAC_38785 [Pristionchus pacificus]